MCVLSGGQPGLRARSTATSVRVGRELAPAHDGLSLHGRREVDRAGRGRVIVRQGQRLAQAEQAARGIDRVTGRRYGLGRHCSPPPPTFRRLIDAAVVNAQPVALSGLPVPSEPIGQLAVVHVAPLQLGFGQEGRPRRAPAASSPRVRELLPYALLDAGHTMPILVASSITNARCSATSSRYRSSGSNGQLDGHAAPQSSSAALPRPARAAFGAAQSLPRAGGTPGTARRRSGPAG